MMDMDDWLKEGKYLPKFMRDFHDQKELFKTIHERINLDNNPYCKDVNWIAGQCYVIDIFLWFMARRGYTLQKNRSHVEFRDINADLRESHEARTEAHFAALKQGLPK